MLLVVLLFKSKSSNTYSYYQQSKLLLVSTRHMDFEAFSMHSNMYTIFQSKDNTRIQTMKIAPEVQFYQVI